MLNWTKLARAENRMIGSLNLILCDHSKLLEFLFESERPRLRQEPELLLSAASGFFRGQQTLIRIAVDLWCGAGSVQLWQVIEHHIEISDDTNHVFMQASNKSMRQLQGALNRIQLYAKLNGYPVPHNLLKQIMST